MSARTNPLITGVPSLTQWLGSAPSGDGFAEFERWAQGMIALEGQGTDAQQALSLRLIKTFTVACVEQLNREGPEAALDAIALWARTAGYVQMMVFASVARDDTPFRSVAKAFTEEFRRGAKLAADSLAEMEQGS